MASLLLDVAAGRVAAADAIARTREWVEYPWTDRLLSRAFDSLQHFEADEDIRARETEYAIGQIETLRRIATALDHDGT